MIYNISSLDEMEILAKKLAPALEGQTVFLNGNLGAGKTTFVSFVATALGGADQAASPTFSIANRYTAKNMSVLHIDLYRIEAEDELEMTGFWEIIEEKATIFIEWAGKFPLKQYIKKYIEIEISYSPTGERWVKMVTS